MRRLSSIYRSSVGGLPPVFWAIWWGTLVNRLANFVGTFLALYLRQEREFGTAAAGWVVALWGLGGTLVSPLGGALTDRLGRRATMLAGLVLGGLAVLAIAFTRHPAALCALSFVGGATGQLWFPASNAAIADVVAPEDRPRAYGLVYWAVNMGLALGFAAAGFMAAHSLLALFVADALTTFACAAVIAVKVPETRPTVARHEPVLSGLRLVFTDGPYVTFLALHLLALVVFTQFQLALPLDMAAHGVPPSSFALLMAFNCVGVVLLQPWLTPLLRRFDGAALLAASTLLFGLGYGLDALVSTLPLYLLGAAFWTVGEVVGFPVAAALVADLAPLPLRGRYQGAFSMTWGLGMTLSPIAGGEIIQRLGAPALWGACLATGVLVALGHLAAGGPRRRRLALLAAAARAAAPAEAARSP